MVRTAILFIALAAVGCSGAPDRQEKESVEDLWRAFEADEAAARARFAGAAIEVDGTLEAIASPGGAKPVLYLRTPGSSAPAFLAEGPAPAALRKARGQRIRLRCESVQNVGLTPYLYNCRPT